MLKADFSQYTLALVEGDKIIFSSDRHGLRPLMDCLENYGGKKEKLVLHDKVIGLAAAKLIVYSGIISSIQTTLTSTPAKKFLEANGIKVYTDKIVENILTRDRRSICPGEVIALNTAEPDAFSKHIMALLSDL